MFYYLCFPINHIEDNLVTHILENYKINLDSNNKYLNFELSDSTISKEISLFTYPLLSTGDILINYNEFERLIKLLNIDNNLAIQYCLGLLNKYETIKNEKRTK